MAVTCTGPGFTFDVNDFRIAGLLTANVSFAMTDAGFSLSGSATPFKLGPLSVTGTTSAGPSISLKVIYTQPIQDSFAISARVQLFGLYVAITAQLSVSKINFAADINLGIISMSLDFATTGPLTDPEAITFAGKFTVGTLPSLEASIISGVKAVGKDLAKLVPEIGLDAVTETEPPEELTLLLDDANSDDAKHGGRRLLGFFRKWAHTVKNVATHDTHTVANVATHDDHTVANVATHDTHTVAHVTTHDTQVVKKAVVKTADTVAHTTVQAADAVADFAKSVANTLKVISEIKLNSVAVSGDLNLSGGPCSFSLDIIFTVCGKTHTFDFTLDQSSLTPKGVVDGFVNSVKRGWKGMC